MPNKLTVDEQINLILGTIELGRRANVKKNLRYIVTELGGTFVSVPDPEIEDEDEAR